MRYQLLKYSSNISIENSFDDEKEELYDTYRVPNDKTILLNDENRNLAPWDLRAKYRFARRKGSDRSNRDARA